MRKATISYETGKLAAIENFKKGTSNDAFDNEFYNEYAGYINEELYQQGVDRFTTIIEGYNTSKKTTNEVYKNTAT